MTTRFWNPTGLIATLTTARCQALGEVHQRAVHAGAGFA